MEIVSKAKRNCTAYEKPAPRSAKRGRSPKKGETVHLEKLFSSCHEQFLETEVVLYGKKQTIRYFTELKASGLYFPNALLIVVI